VTPLRIAVAGACGRMGRTLVRLAAADPAFRVVAAVDQAGAAGVGQDAGVLAGVEPLGVAVADRCPTDVDVLIEFTSSTGCRAWAEWCGRQRVRLVSGTTGIDAAARAALQAAAEQVAVLWSPNMSVGVNLLLELVSRAAAVLGDDWDVEISEAHHRQKTDAPSGTARALLEAVCAARRVEAERVAVHGRRSQLGPRKPGEIGVHALRLGGIVGAHDVHFASAGEVLTLSHRALSRDIFAAGALRAARWIMSCPPGLYSMRDALQG